MCNALLIGGCIECSDIIFGCADVAQTVEQLIRNEKVEGSIPFIGTTSVKSNSFDCIVRSSGSEVKKTNGLLAVNPFNLRASIAHQVRQMTGGKGPPTAFLEPQGDSLSLIHISEPTRPY